MLSRWAAGSWWSGTTGASLPTRSIRTWWVLRGSLERYRLRGLANALSLSDRAPELAGIDRIRWPRRRCRGAEHESRAVCSTRRTSDRRQPSRKVGRLHANRIIVITTQGEVWAHAITGNMIGEPSVSAIFQVRLSRPILRTSMFSWREHESS